ncbi:MAG: translation initiation factor IF-3 [Clostridiales bacterium]|nr:translation initiation factor IF-3 [Clostridiales bacterium]
MINEQIRDKEVRVISENGEQLGIMPIQKALGLADEKQLDLVRIAPNAKPPVCKIMDYGKYMFELSKKEKEARKNQRVINVKEVRLSASIEEHDLGVKARNADKFLKAGNKVKVSIRFRGREMSHSQVGYEIMEKFISMLSVDAVVERKPRLEGWNMIMILAPSN